MVNKIHRLKTSVIFILSMILAISFLLSCTLSRILYYNSSSIEDYKIFWNRELRTSSSPFHFIRNLDQSRIPKEIKYGNKVNIPFADFLESSKTVAFLIIKNDTLLFEKYYIGYEDSSLSLSFSISKSIFSLLVGCAIDDGIINSVDQFVTDFVPELKDNGFEGATIRHLLQMTSGMEYRQFENPFGLHSHNYYTKNIEERLLKLKLKEAPGVRFEYKCGDTQLLGLILARALKTKTITAYFQEKIWEPIGMEFNGLWSTDHEGGLEKTYCGISARARDFAKFGRLFLRDGDWDGKQIVSRSWIQQSKKIDTIQGSAWNYQYQWWLVSRENRDYMAKGYLGQYLYINPEKQLIILRLGKRRGVKRKEWVEIFTYLAKEI